MGDRLIYIIIILGVLNMALLVINITVTERSIKSKVDEKLKRKGIIKCKTTYGFNGIL